MRLPFCVLCGQEDPTTLQHHHFRPRSLGGTDDEKNMFTVCGTCHGEIHDIPRPLRLGELISHGFVTANQRSAEEHLSIATKLRERVLRIEQYAKLAIERPEPVLEPVPEPVLEPVPEPVLEPVLEPVPEPVEITEEPILIEISEQTDKIEIIEHPTTEINPITKFRLIEYDEFLPSIKQDKLGCPIGIGEPIWDKKFGLLLVYDKHRKQLIIRCPYCYIGFVNGDIGQRIQKHSSHCKM